MAGEVFRELENQQWLLQVLDRNTAIIEMGGARDEASSNIDHRLRDSNGVHFTTVGAKSG
jgi:hypothetical protein